MDETELFRVYRERSGTEVIWPVIVPIVAFGWMMWCLKETPFALPVSIVIGAVAAAVAVVGFVYDKRYVIVCGSCLVIRRFRRRTRVAFSELSVETEESVTSSRGQPSYKILHYHLMRGKKCMFTLYESERPDRDHSGLQNQDRLLELLRERNVPFGRRWNDW